MTEILLSYPAVLLRNWKLGRVQRNWYLRDRATFSERDLSNAMGQCRKGFHFGEWFIARHFLRQGYNVLTEKYLHSSRPEKQRKAKEILGKAGVAFLTQRQSFGGSKLRKSPRPDLLVYESNLKTFFFVEVKRDADRLSRPQRLFFPTIEEKLRCEVIVVKLTVEK
jgi:hypothetical protein